MGVVRNVRGRWVRIVGLIALGLVAGASFSSTIEATRGVVTQTAGLVVCRLLPRRLLKRLGLLAVSAKAWDFAEERNKVGAPASTLRSRLLAHLFVQLVDFGLGDMVCHLAKD